MIVSHLELVDFRNYASGTFELTAGTTAIIGDNGQGKTNLAEALAFLATLNSFRSAPGTHSSGWARRRRSSVPWCSTTTAARA